MPHLTALLTKKTIIVKGADDLRAGRVHLDVKGRGIVEFMTFKKGYDVADFTADVNKFGAKNDIKALKRAISNSTIVGGFSGGGSGTIVFPKPGAYTPFSIGERGVVTGKTLVVDGPKRSSKTPSTDGSIIGKNGPSWGGASQLPDEGSVPVQEQGGPSRTSWPAAGRGGHHDRPGADATCRAGRRHRPRGRSRPAWRPGRSAPAAA